MNLNCSRTTLRITVLLPLLLGRNVAAQQNANGSSGGLLWSSTGGGWRAMFADVGFANLFRQAGLMDEESTQFDAVVRTCKSSRIVLMDKKLLGNLLVEDSHCTIPRNCLTFSGTATGDRIGRILVFDPTFLFPRILQSSRPSRNSGGAGILRFTMDESVLQVVQRHQQRDQNRMRYDRSRIGGRRGTLHHGNRPRRHFERNL